MTDFRALCVELVELSGPTNSIPQLAERLQKLAELANRARAALAQPEPVAPKLNIISKPQFPPPQIICEDFLP